MNVLELFVLLKRILTRCTVWDGKRAVDSEGESLTLGSGKHKAGNGKQSAASGKRKGTDGLRYHEAEHRESQQWKRKVGNGQFKVTGEQWTGGTVSLLNWNLSSCRCSRENDSLPRYDAPPASCKISAGTIVHDDVERGI